MIIFGLEPGLGASYAGRRIVDDEEVYGIGVVKVDEEKSYLIQQLRTNDDVDGAPAFADYVAVQTDSLYILSEEDIVDYDEPLEEAKSEEEAPKKLTKENLGKRLISPFTRDKL